MAEVVEVGVKRRGARVLDHLRKDTGSVRGTSHKVARDALCTYVVALLLEPVEGLLRAVRTVTRRCLRLTIFGILAAATWDFGLGQSYFRRRTADIAPEAVHVVCTTHR